jgi:acyl carrier protein
MNEKLTDKLRSIVADVLQIDIAPGEEVERAAHATWDSLNHLRVVMSVEEEFGVRLAPREVVSISSLSDLEKLVQAKL